MPDSDNLETRVAILEHEVARLREQAALTRSDAAARMWAAGPDHDVSEVRVELRAHTQSLNALRETQLEQGQAIAEQGQAITSLDQRMTEGFASLNQEMTEGFATLNTGMVQITALLTGTAGSEQD